MDSAKRRRTPFSGKDGQYPPDMDRDMIPLCDALNALPGVRTFFCCSGHGRRNEGEFYICMGCSSMRSLKRVARAFGRRAGDNFVAARYVVELDHEFWPLRKDEVCVRVGNKRVDHLNARERKKEFGAVKGYCMEPAEIIDDVFRPMHVVGLSEDEATSIALAYSAASYDEYMLRCEVAGVRPLFSREEFEA